MNDFELRRLKERAVQAALAPSRQRTTEELLRAMAGPEDCPEPEEGNDLDADDFEGWFVEALRQRVDGQLHETLNAVEHPTSHVLRIGIASVRNGKPSATFLALLDMMADVAEDTDVLAHICAEAFPKLRVNTFEQQRRHDHIVRRFRAHVRRELDRPRPRKHGVAVSLTFEDVVESFKLAECETGSPDADKAKRKDIGRALFDSPAGAEIRAWRERIEATRGSA